VNRIGIVADKTYLLKRIGKMLTILSDEQEILPIQPMRYLKEGSIFNN